MNDTPTARPLDALVASRVLGWMICGCARGIDCTLHLPPGDATARDLPRYSTDIAAAWEVVRAMRKRGLLLELCDTTNEMGWYARFCGVGYTSYARGQTAEEVICRAALAAVEGTTP